MNDIERALSDIANIRSQMADVQLFRGFGPLVIGVTGILALALATGQSLAIVPTILTSWIVLACACAALIGTEMWALTRRTGGSNAYDQLWAIVQKFIPCLLAGAAIGWIILTQAPEQEWLLPGIWQVLIGLGLFSATSMLPRHVMLAAGWYLVAGLIVFLVSVQSMSLTPWMMGVPFGFGQILMALLLHRSPEKRNGGF